MKRKKVLVCGDRDWVKPEKYGAKVKSNAEMIERHLREERAEIVIHGDAPGADRAGASAARRMGIKERDIHAHPAKWDLYGRAAGPIRNSEMAEERPHLVLAYHDDIAGASRGTKDMVTKAMRAGITVKLYTSDGDRVDLIKTLGVASAKRTMLL